MLGGMTCMSVVLGMAVCAAGANHDRRTTEIVQASPLSAPSLPAFKSAPAQTASNDKPKSFTAQEPPTAPLPPALWPGLIILVVLGAARIVYGAARTTARR